MVAQTSKLLLCEVVFDITRYVSFQIRNNDSIDSRELCQAVIAWAEEFEANNVGVQWGEANPACGKCLGTGKEVKPETTVPCECFRDYYIEVDAFAEEKFKESEWYVEPPPAHGLTDAQYIAMAKQEHHDLGYVEVDDNAEVSRASDEDSEDGAYVSAWVWVDAPKTSAEVEN